MVLQDPKIRKRHWGISHWVTCKTFQITNSDGKEVKTNFSLLTMLLNKSLLHKKMRNCDIQVIIYINLALTLYWIANHSFQNTLVKEQTGFIWYLYVFHYSMEDGK